MKNLPAVPETGFKAWVGKIPWRRAWPPTPVFLPAEFREKRSLVDYSHGVSKNLAELSD